MGPFQRKKRNRELDGNFSPFLVEGNQNFDKMSSQNFSVGVFLDRKTFLPLIDFNGIYFVLYRTSTAPDS